MPPSAKPPKRSVKSPVPSTSVTAAMIRLALLLKSTLLSTQIFAPAIAMRPNTTMLTPPITASGMVWISAPNFGLKPSTMAISAATTNIAVE